MSKGKIAFATISALYGALAATSLRADDAAPPAASSEPAARPADAALDQPQNSAPNAQPARAADEKPASPITSDQSSQLIQLQALLRRETATTNLPFDIADTVAAIESGYNPGAIGTVGEIGLMQVRPETAAMLGFRGDAAELAKPEVNIHYGVAYLAEAWRLADGDVCRALMKYRAGHGEERMSELSASYCGRARAHLAAIGSPLAGGISVPVVAESAIGARVTGGRAAMPRLPRIRTAAVSRAFWAAHEARIAALTRKVEAKWRKMASR